MKAEEVVAIFKETGALLDGHFVYTSGRHGRQFLQAARVLQYPSHTERLCAAMAALYDGKEPIDLVVGPATGGIILAYDTARCLNARAAFAEKDGKGGMALKRGFLLEAGTRVLVVEDVITTGGSVQKVVDHLRERGAEVAGVVVLVDRSDGTARFDCPFDSLAQISMETWAPDDCALCRAEEPLVEPDDILL